MNNKIMAWFYLQDQRLREQGVQRRARSMVKKFLKSLFLKAAGRLQDYPHFRAIAQKLVTAMGLNTRLKRLLKGEYPRKEIPLSMRAEIVLQDMKKAIAELEKSR